MQAHDIPGSPTQWPLGETLVPAAAMISATSSSPVASQAVASSGFAEMGSAEAVGIWVSSFIGVITLASTHPSTPYSTPKGVLIGSLDLLSGFSDFLTEAHNRSSCHEALAQGPAHGRMGPWAPGSTGPWAFGPFGPRAPGPLGP